MTFCKYCKSQEHEIDNCKDILCRLCKKYGHPHWKCNLNPRNPKFNSNSEYKNNFRDRNKNNNDNGNDNGNENKDENKDENKIDKKDIEKKIMNLDEIEKYIGIKWSLLS